MRTSPLLAIATVVISCAKEPDREEVIGKHRAAVEAVLAKVKIVGKVLARNEPPPAEGPALSSDPVWLEYPTPYKPADPTANSLLAYEQDLVDLGKRGDLAEELRIPYSGILTECATVMAGGATDMHPEFLDVLLGDCAKVRYLFAIRIKELKEPYANPDDKTFTPGLLDTAVIVFDLDAPDSPIGGYAVRTESAREAFVQSGGKGPQGALMSAFDSAVRYGAKTARR
jgi:hypothetical protein